MTTEEFRKWSVSLGLLEQTYTQIEQIRNTQPSRRVGGRAGNVSGRYPSRKMGMVIQFELCNTLSVQRLQDKASIVVNALHNDIQACKQY